MSKKKCENCYWYRWEDSVWGYCWRYPPKLRLKSVFPKIKYHKVDRPEVNYNEPVCGEFKERQLKI